MLHPLHIIDRGDTFVVRGNAWPFLTGAGIKPFYCGGTSMGFVVDRGRLGDLCAYLDSRHIPYRIKRGDIEPASTMTSTAVNDTISTAISSTSISEPTLFDFDGGEVA